MARGLKGHKGRGRTGVRRNLRAAGAAFANGDMLSAAHFLSRVAKQRPRTRRHFLQSAGRVRGQLANMLADGTRAA
jgi:hypothetical protein